MTYAIVALFGAAFGSFFNMLIHRLPNREDIALKPSYCPKCQHRLFPQDLIPIFSFLFQLGRCRHCQAPIKKRYLMVELLTVFCAVTLFHIYGLGFDFAKSALFISAMIVLFFTDLETYILPDSITFPLIVVGAVFAVAEHQVRDRGLGFLVGLTTFFLIGFIGKLIYKKATIGGGDIKLGAAIGIWWGVKLTAIAIYLSFLIGGIVGLILIATKHKTRKDYMPFGPAIIAGFMVALAWGNDLWSLFIETGL